MKFWSSLLFAVIAWLWGGVAFAADPTHILGPCSPWENDISAVESLDYDGVFVLRQNGAFYHATLDDLAPCSGGPDGKWDHTQLCTVKNVTGTSTGGADYEGLALVTEIDGEEEEIYRFFALSENGYYDQPNNLYYSAFVEFDTSNGNIINRWRIPHSAMPIENGPGAGPEGIAIRKWWEVDEITQEVTVKWQIFIAHQLAYSGNTSRVYEFVYNGWEWEADSDSDGWNNAYTASRVHTMPYNESCGLDILPSEEWHKDVLYVLHGDTNRVITRWELQDGVDMALDDLSDHTSLGITTPNNVEGLSIGVNKNLSPLLYFFYACDQQGSTGNGTEGVWYDEDGL